MLPADRLRARRGADGRTRREEDAGEAAWTPGGRSRRAGGRPSCDVEAASRPPEVEPPANTNPRQTFIGRKRELFDTSSYLCILMLIVFCQPCSCGFSVWPDCELFLCSTVHHHRSDSTRLPWGLGLRTHPAFWNAVRDRPVPCGSWRRQSWWRNHHPRQDLASQNFYLFNTIIHGLRTFPTLTHKGQVCLKYSNVMHLAWLDSMNCLKIKEKNVQRVRLKLRKDRTSLMRVSKKLRTKITH